MTASTPAAAPTSVVPSGPLQPTRKIIKRPANAGDPLIRRQQRPRPQSGTARVAAESRKTASPPPHTNANTATASQVEPVHQPDWQEFKLVTTKREILAGYRHHVMRLQSKRMVNPMNPEEFTMPVRLHRRDPRAPLQGGKEQLAMAQAANVKTEDEDPAAAEERAKKEALKAAQQEKIAPYGGAQKKQKQMFKKKTQQVFQQNEADKKLRYEEFFPWFIEDFDNKNTWQGQLETPLSGCAFAMFVLDEGAFKMVPIEKWYKFTEKNKFTTLSIEEAESAMKKASRAPRWLMKLTKEDEKKQEREEQQANLSALNRLKTRKGGRLDKILPKSETADADEVDFDDDRFADDEEAPVMEGEEQENKEIEKRIKKEQLSANVFDTRDEKEYEEEENERKKLERMREKQGKKTRKALMHREGNYTYESDSDENPYKDSSDEEEDDDEEIARKEEERKKEEELKKDEERKKAEPAKEQDKKPPVPSQDPKIKLSSPAKKQSQPTAAGEKVSGKRTGSADLSESGNEKARKKPKKSQAPPSTAAPKSSAGPTQGKKRKAVGEAGSGSGDDTTGEMSDSNTAKKPRVKLVAGGRALSPQVQGSNSRHGSPVPGAKSLAGSPNAPAGASRAGSPAAPTVPSGPISDEEILAVIGPEGTTTAALAGIFKLRLADKDVKANFVSSLKRLVESRGGSKMLFKKGPPRAE